MANNPAQATVPAPDWAVEEAARWDAVQDLASFNALKTDKHVHTLIKSHVDPLKAQIQPFKTELKSVHAGGKLIHDAQHRAATRVKGSAPPDENIPDLEDL